MFARSLLGAWLMAAVGFAQAPPPRPDAVTTISQALRQGEFTQAEALCVSALRATPRDVRLWTLQAIAQASLQQPTRAMASFQHALQLDPEYLPALSGAAQLSFEEKLPQTPLLLKHVLRLHPEDQGAEAMLGMVDAQQHDCSGAVAAFAKASEAVRGHMEALEVYSTCLVTLSRYGEAISVFQAMLQLAPGDETLLYNLALAQSDAGQPGAAITTLAPLVSARDPREDVLTLAASASEATGDTQQALEQLRQAILLHPHEQDAYLDYVNLAYRHGSYQVGIDIVNVGLQQNPTAGQLYFARGVLEAQLARVNDALADFDQAGHFDPKLSNVGTAKGIAQSQLHEFGAALDTLRQQVKAHPDDALAYYLLAEAIQQQGAPADSPLFHEEVNSAERAVALDPKQVQAHDLLATSYLAIGDHVSAARECRAALATNPNDQDALYHLILALRRSPQATEIPDLVKKLMQARQLATQQAERSRVHKLVEASDSSSTKGGPQP